MQSHDQELEDKVGRELRGIGIPPCPAVLLKITKEAQKTEPDFNTLAEIIGDDVGLSAGLIKVANSPYFGFQKKVRSIHEAMLVIGLKTIIHAIAGLELPKAFAHTARLERFWHSSTQTARTAAWLANHLPGISVRSVDAYTYGLFHNCGVAVLSAPFKEYLNVLQQANNDATRPFTETEDDHFGINHAVVGSELAMEWMLPAELCVGIRHHHDRTVIEGNTNGVSLASRHIIAIGHLAEHCNYAHTNLNFSREWDKLGPACLSVLGIDSASFEQLRDASAVALEGA